MLLYIIRHGEPVYTTDSLTERGARQADALAQRLSVHGFDVIYSSPNGRARLTAQPTCDLLNLEYKIEDWMSEDYTFRDFSREIAPGKKNWAILSQNTVYKRDAVIDADKEWHEADYLINTDAKEGYRRIQEHSDVFLEQLGYKRENSIYKILKNNEDRIGIFCHHVFGVMWLSYLLAIPPNLFWSSFIISHTGVTILEFKNNPDGFTAPMCHCLSDLSHIDITEQPFTKTRS